MVKYLIRISKAMLLTANKESDLVQPSRFSIWKHWWTFWRAKTDSFWRIIAGCSMDTLVSLMVRRLKITELLCALTQDPVTLSWERQPKLCLVLPQVLVSPCSQLHLCNCKDTKVTTLSMTLSGSAKHITLEKHSLRFHWHLTRCCSSPETPMMLSFHLHACVYVWIIVSSQSSPCMKTMQSGGTISSKWIVVLWKNSLLRSLTKSKLANMMFTSVDTKISSKTNSKSSNASVSSC